MLSLDLKAAQSGFQPRSPNTALSGNEQRQTGGAVPRLLITARPAPAARSMLSHTHTHTLNTLNTLDTH